jgi:type III HopA1-like effector protein
MTTKPDELEQQLEKIVAEISIVSPDSFIFSGEEIKVSSATAQGLSVPAPSTPLVLRLQEHLYQRCYCAVHSDNGSAQPPPSEGEEFVRKLSKANASVSRWDANWRVWRVESTGQIWAEKGGGLRLFQPGEFINFEEAGSSLRAGSTVSAYIVRESTTVQPGLYFAFGETVSASDHLDLFRLYWNIDSIGVLSLLRCVTRDLNRFQVPFQFKSSVWPQGYARRDAAVLYVKKKFYRLVRTLAAAWVCECSGSLRKDVPLFTLPIAPGLGLAEDPETGESFGMNRCRHVAEALWSGHQRQVPNNEYLRAVKEHFRQQELDFQRPYLNPGSVDLYAPGTRSN